MISQHAIAKYQAAKIALNERWLEAKEQLLALGWRLVKEDSSAYGDSGCYNYLLVCPEMFDSLTLEEGFVDGIPLIVSDFEDAWLEGSHYIWF